MTQFYNEYPKVLVSVDCIIFGFNGNNLQVLIGKRKMDPGRGEWSLYGGFVGANKNLRGRCKQSHPRSNWNEEPLS